jgi:hypothetical protein
VKEQYSQAMGARLEWLLKSSVQMRQLCSIFDYDSRIRYTLGLNAVYNINFNHFVKNTSKKIEPFLTK